MNKGLRMVGLAPSASTVKPLVAEAGMSNGWKIEREKGIFGHGGRGAFVVWEEMRFAPTFYPISTTYAMSATATSDRAE